MKLGNITLASISGVFLISLSLLFNYSYTWSTSNSQGAISYRMRAFGLPLQYVYQEVSSPVGPSSFFKVSPGNLVLDFVVWAVLAYLVLRLARRETSHQVAPTSA